MLVLLNKDATQRHGSPMTSQLPGQKQMARAPLPISLSLSLEPVLLEGHKGYWEESLERHRPPPI